MSKKTSQMVEAGQLAGAKVSIKRIHNDGLQEAVLLQNLGTVAQPMGGWVLASFRGNSFFSFPADLNFLPGTTIIVYSGQPLERQVQTGWSSTINLFWTNEQVWNNHGDMAIVFDADGVEVDRRAYPHERIMGSDDKHTMMLIQNVDGYQIIETPARQSRKTIRHANRLSTN
jgi:hypothetical protein